MLCSSSFHFSLPCYVSRADCAPLAPHFPAVGSKQGLLLSPFTSLLCAQLCVKSSACSCSTSPPMAAEDLSQSEARIIAMQQPPWVLGNYIFKGSQCNVSEGRLMELWTSFPSIPCPTESPARKICFFLREEAMAMVGTVQQPECHVRVVQGTENVDLLPLLSLCRDWVPLLCS